MERTLLLQAVGIISIAANTGNRKFFILKAV